MAITTREELLAMHERTCKAAVEIMKVKNADYGASADALRNFRLCDMLGVPLTHGIVTRLGDKLARIGKIVTSGETAVKSETVTDTILDMINYAIILRAALCEKKEDHEENIHKSPRSDHN